MDVSIQCYRIRIGSFQPKVPVHRSQKFKTTKFKSASTFQFLFNLYLISHVYSQLPRSAPSPSSSYLTARARGPSTLGTEWQCGLRGLPAGLTNKACHALSGNRKAQGLILSSWNCGRAVANKVEDIKLFIEEHTPSTRYIWNWSTWSSIIFY